ncbi:hypothetical protein Gotri_005892, partial [Gossypium trilobum]|nr:hypothetical protein [Gossypium trilobum]
MCWDIQETFIHTLCDCSVAAKVCEKVIPLNYLSHFFNLDHLDWVITNLNGDFGGDDAMRDSLVKWHSPSSGWVKVNVDGSFNMNGHCLMVGGVVRGSAGNWLEGFKEYIGRGFALNSKLWAILTGFEVARLQNYSKIIVESECLDAIEMILGNSMNTPLMTLIRQIMKAK